ncbi:hypothetical protein [Pedococcus bigeumensis]|jgi:hypothetical protein|uniref:hypothetical protein n=1 Tax=Pedococcus bigeumensis TaxID=433644 RepID=UPI002FEBF91E
MDPALESEPRPDTPAAGNALVWMTLSLFAFGVFLVTIPGHDPAGRAWLWIGIVLLVVGGISSAFAVRARIRHLRG